MKTVYISIGNSDDKLIQGEWAAYWGLVDRLLYNHNHVEIHGVWESASTSAYQNACWCIELHPRYAEELKAELRQIAAKFRQDSIAWAVADTEFLKP